MPRLPTFLASALLIALPTFAGQKQAISATVTGDDQQVVFRAMVMKQAIECNLAGFAKIKTSNRAIYASGRSGSYQLGDCNDTRGAVTIPGVTAEGTRRSSNIEVSTIPAAVDTALNTLTVVDWTSSSRHVTTPYALVFKLRRSDEEISKSAAKAVWHQILQTTVKGDDLRKLGNDD
jgi:acylphosphatase